MTFCRHCEVSWVVGDRCWIPDCGRVGEAGGFPKRWLTAGDDHADIAERLRRWRAYTKARAEYANTVGAP